MSFKKIPILSILTFITEPRFIFDFEINSDLQDWKIVNEGMMRGISKSTFEISKDGNGIFKGEVSLENYGVFLLCRYHLGNTNIKNYSRIRLRLKRDGKKISVPN